MNRLSLIAGAAALIWAGAGCKEYKRISMAQVEQMYDSLKTIPGVVSMHILQDDDYTNVAVIVGDAPLYDAGKDKVQETADRVGLMLLHVLGPDNNLSRGTFAVARKDLNEDKIPDDAIKADMHIADAKKIF